MYLNELRVGQVFYIDSWTDAAQTIWVAVCAPFIKKGLDGDSYWCVNATNLQTGVTMPFSVHTKYPHYLRVQDISLMQQPTIEFEWSTDEFSR